MHDTVRRRRGLTSDSLLEGADSLAEDLEEEERQQQQGPPLPNGKSHHQSRGRQQAQFTAPLDMHAVRDFFSWRHLSRSIGESALVQKIKQVANQPALAGASMGSIGDVAEGVLLSVTHAAAGPGGGGSGLGLSHSRSRGELQTLPRNLSTASLLAKQKHDGKSD